MEKKSKTEHHNNIKLIKEWFPVTSDEMRVFFAFIIFTYYIPIVL